MATSDNSDGKPMACNGGETVRAYDGDAMEECQACGMAVRWDLVGHKFFGFVAGCSHWKKLPSA